MADNSNTLQLTLQIKEDGSVVIDKVKSKIDDPQKSTTSGGKSVQDVNFRQWEILREIIKFRKKILKNRR